MPRAVLVTTVMLIAAAPARGDRIVPTGEVGGLLHRPAGDLGDELGPATTGAGCPARAR